MQNPSIVLYGPGNAKLEDKPIPEIVDGHDVIVRIAFVGVCGSDVSLHFTPKAYFDAAGQVLITAITRFTFGDTGALASTLTRHPALSWATKLPEPFPP
jgi:NADPH:quinone reductase-like Zn-dependent oxidoreductase